MISLFIDTSLSDVSIALVKDNIILSNIKNTSPKEHSIYTTKFIEDILKENNLVPNDINEIIVVNGPGSFTGIRIGVTIAKMYAYLLKKDIKEIENVLNDLNLNYKIENMDIKNPKNEKGNQKNYVDCIMTFKVI